MRKRWRKDDTPVSIQVLLGVFVLGWFCLGSWWEYEKFHDTLGDWYWPITLAPPALLVGVILVGLVGSWLKRRRERRARDERVRHGDSRP